MKTRLRKKIQPIYLMVGDSIELWYADGKRNRLAAKSTAGRQLTVNEVEIFDVESGDFEGAQDGIGGVFLSCKEIGDVET